uniref:Uncharacterized protein n=1 Tax=Homalodisca liturata TaxID=320908 RepID=A0A1B6HKG0_9HEMI
MYVRSFLILFLASYCLGTFYDFVVNKDEEARKILTDPRGTDTDMFSKMKSVGDSFELLTKYLRLKNASLMTDSRKLYDRGTPMLLTEVFSTDNLRVYFGWLESDVHYFNYVYNDVLNKWDTFQKVFKNCSMFM